MKITIQSIHFDASARLKTYIEKKCNKLDQFYDRITEGTITLKVQNEMKPNNKFVEIKLNVPGDILVVKEHAKTFEAATDLSTDKLKEQLRRYKGKAKAH
ncbi:MAG: ribosome-associated translation inhibitor RaiA [Bacteroidetes bacterium]|nr:ribosome-associated translation inhibitor RaiA [Bacteroidota bacterium]MCB0845344.1 ribosome-associated translation inhibitor RaiA [Bacteroidota bacterium]